jgi:hypothetical protein
VFFSFHYQDVIDFRANVVRLHKTTKDDNAGYFDASIWETAKKTGELALKRLINGELQNTSVTAVLIGSETYNRRWVRYEIMRSMFKGNHILGININSITGKDQKTKALGPNPFEYLGIQYSEDGTKVSLFEYKHGKWVSYGDMDDYKLNQPVKNNSGKFFQLSHFYKTYDWIRDDGYNKFSNWI